MGLILEPPVLLNLYKRCMLQLTMRETFIIHKICTCVCVCVCVRARVSAIIQCVRACVCVHNRENVSVSLSHSLSHTYAHAMSVIHSHTVHVHT